MTTSGFWAKVDRSGDCWVWTGYCDDKGYGRTFADGHHIKAHRLAYRLAHGEIPDGAHVLHSCDNPPCVNPDHLRAGTRSDNMRDKVARGRDFNVRKTECIHGHQFNDLNTYIRPNGNRACRTCQIERKRAYRQRVAQRKAA